MNEKTNSCCNVVWHHTRVNRSDREKLNGHRSFVLWFTGLSHSGKSTIANSVDAFLFEKCYRTYVLDGDNVRHGLNKNLSFTPEDRSENIRRIGEVVKLFLDAGTIVLAAFISPYNKDREGLRELLGSESFIEIYVECDVETCVKRDGKGFYGQALSGKIKNYTGINDPYEAPENPDIVLDSDRLSVDECRDEIISYLQNKGFIK